MLDENFGLIRANAAFEVDDDHFSRVTASNNEEEYPEIPSSFEQQTKFLLFVKIQENNRQKYQRKLKQRLDEETEKFIEDNLEGKDTGRVRQLFRNILELIA